MMNFGGKPDPKVTCHFKKFFASIHDFNGHRDKILRDHGTRLYWYKCPYCKMFHATKIPQNNNE